MSKGRVWITGGGTGIGKELAKIFCNNGYNVIISGRRKEKLIEVAKYNKKKIFPFKLDVSNFKEANSVAKNIIEKFKFIDLLILINFINVNMFLLIKSKVSRCPCLRWGGGLG